VEIRDLPPPFWTVVFDADSTLSAIEGIDELAGEPAGQPAGRRRVETARLTERAMAGEIPLEAVYGARLALIRPSRAALERLGALYVERALPHARELVAALHALGKRVCVVSGGLEPAVRALAGHLGIEDADVHAVSIRFDEAGAYAGFDESSPLARPGGKPGVVAGIARASPGPLALVGDGVTDLEAAVAAARFVAFAGVARRESVLARARVRCERADLAALVPLLLSPDEQERLARLPAHAPLLLAAADA